jgi:cell division transport system permease protein
VKIRKIRRRIRAWGRRQLYSFFSSLGSLLSHRLGTLMTVLVLGIAMALPLGLYVSVKNMRALDLQQEDWGTITVFLNIGIDGEQATALARRIEMEQNALAETISPAEGMEEFRETSGFGQALDMFDENPLPWVLQVTPREAGEGGLEKTVTGLGDWLEEQDEVDLVQLDYKWLKRLSGMLQLGDAFVTVLTIMFSLAVVVVVANTIRLDVANRADEIQVLNMVGAGNSFIRQPFLYSGFWYGLLGAGLALVLLNLSMLYLQAPLERLLEAYENTFEVASLGARGSAYVLLAGGLLGFLGAWVSVRRYLRQFRLEKVAVRR